MKTKKLNCIWVAPILTAFIMLLLYAFSGVYPFGSGTTAVTDGVGQYIPFLAEFAEKIGTGGSLFFTWHAGRGVNFWVNIAYYLASPLNILAAFFKPGETDKAFALISLIQIVLSSFTFSLFLKYQYKKKDVSIVIFSLLWAFSGFMIGAMTFTAWFYSIIYFPLVILGLQRLMEGKSGILYTVFLALSIVSNFYIGWITCIFCIIYFIYCLIADDEVVFEGAQASPEESEDETSINIFDVFKNSYLISSFIRFIACSFLAGISTAVFSIPTVYALSSSAKGTVDTDDIINIKNFWSFFASHVFPVKNSYGAMTSTSIIYGFVGILTLILVVAYFFSKGISIRKRIGNLFLLAVMLLSFTFYIPYSIWHGFGVPMGIMFRFVFVYEFVLLKVAFEAYSEKQNLNVIGILLGFVAVVAAGLGLKYAGGTIEMFYTPILLIGIIVLACVYSIILIISRKEKTKNIISFVLALCVVCEILFMYKDNIAISNVDDNISEVAEVSKVTKNIEDSEFLTFNPKKQDFGDVIMYGMEFGFNADEYYSSMADFDNTFVYRCMGSHSNDKNLQNGALGQTPVFNMLFPTKYLLDGKSEYSENWFHKKQSEENGYVFYKNNYTMPFMYTVPYEIENWEPFSYPVPIDMQNATAKVITGTDDMLLTYNKNSKITYENASPMSLSDFYIKLGEEQGVKGVEENTEYYNEIEKKFFGIVCNIKNVNKDAYVSFVSTAQEDGIQYIFVDTNMFNDMYITINGVERKYNVYGINENRIYELSEVKKGDEIFVKIGGHRDTGGTSCYVANLEKISAICFTVNQEKFEKAYNKLDAMSDTEMLEFSDTHVKAKVTSYEDGLLYIPTTFDEGWTITIDGNEVPLYEHESHILMTEISKGEHIVEMKYCPQGFVAGAVITGISLVILVAWAVISKKRSDKVAVCDTIEENAKEE